MSQNIVENFKSMYYGFNLRFMLPLYLDNDTTYILYRMMNVQFTFLLDCIFLSDDITMK